MKIVLLVVRGTSQMAGLCLGSFFLFPLPGILVGKKLVLMDPALDYSKRILQRAV